MATRSWRAVAELAAAQHGVFTRAQAASHQLGPAHIRTLRGRGLLDEPVRGVLREVAARPTWEQAVMVAVLATGGCASGVTAAGLHRLDGFDRDGGVEVCVLRGTHRSVPGVRVRSFGALDPCDVTSVDGIPTLSIARTLCEMGRDVTADQLERALDDALRRGVSARWIASTLDRVARPGPSGSARLARVLALADRGGPVPDSWRERVTERLLRDPELSGLVRQHEVRDRTGRLVARLDLAEPTIRLGIEYHSDQWHYGPRRGRGDRRRDLRLAQYGWQVLYLDASDHRNPAAARRAVLDVVRFRRTVGIA